MLCGNGEEDSMLQLKETSDIQGLNSKNSREELTYTLPNMCTHVARVCGMDWTDGIPAAYANWSALEEGFSVCCEAGGHHGEMCSRLTADAFSSVKSKDFPAEGGAIDESFCRVLHDLVTAHKDWLILGTDKALGLSHVQTVVTAKLSLTQISAPEVFEHWVALGMGATSVALAQMSQTAALAAIGTAVAAHLQSCGKTEEDQAACDELAQANEFMKARKGKHTTFNIWDDCNFGGKAYTCGDCKKEKQTDLDWMYHLSNNNCEKYGTYCSFGGENPNKNPAEFPDRIDYDYYDSPGYYDHKR